MSEKTYINGLFLKKKTFPNGGSVVNVSINVDAFIDELQKYKNNKGYCNIVFQERKEADKFGNNMYSTLNTYTPPASETKTENTTKGDGLPF